MTRALVILLPAAIWSAPLQPAAAADSTSGGAAITSPHLRPVSPSSPLHNVQSEPASRAQCLGAPYRSKPAAEKTPTEADPRLVVSYEPGKLYRVQTAPNFLTVLSLREGERITSKAAGDTLNWSIGETYQGKGSEAKALILVKPHRAGLKTNLVITTDQRAYDVEISSRDSSRYTSLVTWEYGDLANADLSPAPASPNNDAAERITRLNFSYVISHKRRQAPKWSPLRVFDDGERTYIGFPEKIAATSSPPLFQLRSDGSEALVTYRVRDNYYIVDRILSKAELRLGENAAETVTISAEAAHD